MKGGVLAATVIAGIALLGAHGAEADTVTETFAFPTLLGYGSEMGSSFSEFNPALGTLNSVTLDETITATFSNGGSADLNEALYEILLNSVPFGATVPQYGNGSVTSSINDTTATGLSSIIGSGTLMPFIDVSNLFDTPATVSSGFGTATVTYDYTPATAVPEPASLSVFAVGLLGLGWVYRRRTQGAGRPPAPR